MEDKLKMYFSLIDGYDKRKQKFEYYHKFDSKEAELFKSFCPLKPSLIMKYLEQNFNKMVKKYLKKN